jgi:hypothetical protein
VAAIRRVGRRERTGRCRELECRARPSARVDGLGSVVCGPPFHRRLPDPASLTPPLLNRPGSDFSLSPRGSCRRTFPNRKARRPTARGAPTSRRPRMGRAGDAGRSSPCLIHFPSVQSRFTRGQERIYP